MSKLNQADLIAGTSTPPQMDRIQKELRTAVEEQRTLASSGSLASGPSGKAGRSAAPHPDVGNRARFPARSKTLTGVSGLPHSGIPSSHSIDGRSFPFHRTAGFGLFHRGTINPSATEYRLYGLGEEFFLKGLSDYGPELQIGSGGYPPSSAEQRHPHLNN
ncbi:MAG: hypothetical protein R3B83_02650 [Nitrospirales bacterium]|nr:hypothetical protein [Nitrospirales bacterium]